jgi:hypothetical protein
MDPAFVDYYRCPESFVTFARNGELPSRDSGYFYFGSNAVCYGRCSSNSPAEHAADAVYDTLPDVKLDRGQVSLPFDPSEVVANLRYERYASNGNGKRPGNGSILKSASLNSL